MAEFYSLTLNFKSEAEMKAFEEKLNKERTPEVPKPKKAK